VLIIVMLQCAVKAYSTTARNSPFVLEAVGIALGERAATMWGEIAAS